MAGCPILLTLHVPNQIGGYNPRDGVPMTLPELLYNVIFKGGGVRKRVTGRSLRGLRASEVDWLWVIEQKRRATPEEILKLCKGVSKVSRQEN